MRWRRCVIGVVATLLVLLYGPGTLAADWITKGGSPQRMSVVSAPSGLIELTVRWQTQALGASAAQPVVVDGMLYHLAGAHLWKLNLDRIRPPDANATAITDTAKGDPVYFNRAPGGTVIPPQSTPTYSPETGVLYVGTGYGWLWAYHIREGWIRPVELETGCPIVGSPLVIHDRGRDIVVVADRPNHDDEKRQRDGRPICPREDGKVWVVQGLDDRYGWPDAQAYEAPTTKRDEGGFSAASSPHPRFWLRHMARTLAL